MGANNSHISLHRSRRSPRTTTTPLTPATTFSRSVPSTAHGTPAMKYTSTSTYTTPSHSTAPSPTTSYSIPADERTSISCEPATSPVDASRAQVPLRIGYPYYEEVVALEAKQRRGSRKRSRSLGKVLDTIGFNGVGH